MQVTIHGWNKEPEKYGREAQEVDLVVEIGKDTVALLIEDKFVAVTRVEFASLQRLINE